MCPEWKRSGGREYSSEIEWTYVEIRKNQNDGFAKVAHLSREPLNRTNPNGAQKNLMNFEYWRLLNENRLVTFHSCVSHFSINIGAMPDADEHLDYQSEWHIFFISRNKLPFLMTDWAQNAHYVLTRTCSSEYVQREHRECFVEENRQSFSEYEWDEEYTVDIDACSR